MIEIDKPKIVVFKAYENKDVIKIGSSLKLLCKISSKLSRIDKSVPMIPKADDKKHKYRNKSNLLFKILISSIAIPEIFNSVFCILSFLCKRHVRTIDVIGLSVSSHNVRASFLFQFFKRFIIPSTKLGTLMDIILI